MGVVFEPVTIAITTAVSTQFELQGRKLVGVVTPAAWTAADLSLEVYVPPLAAWKKVVDNSGALVKSTGLATGASEVNLLPEIADRIVFNTMRLVSTNTASEADVNQDAARTLYVIMERE